MRDVTIYWHSMVASFTFYDASKNYLNKYYNHDAYGYAQDFVKIPSDAVYCRVSVRLQDDNKVYVAVPKSNKITNELSFIQKSVKQPIVFSNSGYIDTSGNIVANANFFYSDYIPVGQFITDVNIYWHSNVATFTFYDENKQYLNLYKKKTTGLAKDTIDVPYNASYVIVCTDPTFANEAYYVGDVGGIIGNLNNGVTGLSNRVESVNQSLVSAVVAGYAEGEYGEDIESDIGRQLSTNSYTAYNNAYWNGFSVPQGSRVTGILLNNQISSTKFSLYYFNSNFVFLGSQLNIEPVITGHAFDLDVPIEFIQTAGIVMIQPLDGTWYANRHTASDLKEYRPNSNAIYDSPLQMCYDVVYQRIESATFIANGASSSVTPENFIMPKTVPNESGLYTLIGRWFDKTIDGTSYKCTNADGSSVLFRVEGASSITIDFRALSTPNYTPYFAYSIDGNVFTRQLITNTNVSMPDTGEHLVWIVVDGMGETDPNNGKWNGTVGIRLNEISGSSGSTLKSVTIKNKQILFVGDSIVEGINALGTEANADVNSATSGFAWKTACKLNAIPLLFGYGGTSTLGPASFHKAIEAIDYNMDGVPVNLLEPDVILIEHGYNDAGVISLGSKTVEDFIESYSALIERLSVKYSGVPILCMIPFKQSLAQYIRQIAENYSWCYVIETATYTVETSDSAHPSAIGAAHAAESLSADIMQLLGKDFFLNIQ